MAKNRCQYWNLYEAHQCVHWSTDSNSCTYVEEKTDDLVSSLSAESTDKETKEVTVAINAIVQPTYYPSCNYIGTAVLCSNYESSAPGQVLPRCILPDPTRHVCNRWTGKKWVSISTTESVDEYGETVSTTAPDFSPINGYNSGGCNGNGTDTTCSGYSPQHMGFGRLVPSSDETKDTNSDGTYSNIMEFEYRLPLHYVVYNLRVRLSKCFWWKGDYLDFTVSSGTRLVELVGDWLCSNTNDTSTYNDFNAESGPPCNGCKPECPYYTGICWEYCIDDLMQSGDPVLVEQVHELRYYCRENQWLLSSIEDYFSDQGYIYAWGGSHFISADGAAELLGKTSYTINATNNTIEEYQIAAVKTYMQEFDTFKVEHENLTLTKGTTVDNELPTFPNLINEFSLIELSPIIKNRFETPGIFEATGLGAVGLLLYGKIFVPGELFVININHVDIASSVPKELFEYDCLLDIRRSLGTNKYMEFYENYVKTINVLKKIVVTSKNINKLSDEENTTFIAEASLYPDSELSYATSGGKVNILVVFQDTEQGLLFSKINLIKSLVGGALIQTEFSVEGDDVPVKTPFDYTQDFNVYVNHNGQMTFEFCPFYTDRHTYKFSYFYDDYYGSSLSSSTLGSAVTSYRGYKLYKIYAENYILSKGDAGDEDLCEYFLLGSDGYFLIKINDLGLNRVFKPWEFETIEAVFEDGASCEFEVVYSGADLSTLEVNQVIIKPKNSADFRSTCSATLIIKNLTYYKKLSFNEVPTLSNDMWRYSLIDDSGEDLTINYSLASYKAEVEGNNIKVSDFQFAMVPSVVIANMVGRDFTVFRTKPLGWVKQNSCPAVEIQYAWSANYIQWSNVPVCMCCGEWSQQNGQPSGYGLTPPCGDHDISSFFGYGPVWWPFTSCDSYATYDIISNLDNYSFDVIGLFKQNNEAGTKIHGDHDMRMLGPPNNVATHGRGCNFLIRCTCNWRTYNAEKVSDNVFMGWARIRAGVSEEELNEWANGGGVLPKFGNAFRPQLDSYRTLGKDQHVYTNDGGTTWSTAWRMMPAFMGFNKVDFLDNSGGDLWDYGASEIDGAPPVANPLGFFLASSFESKSINEVIDHVNRFTLKEICHANVCVDQIRYPKVAGEYSSTRLAGTVYPWYEFKAHNVAGGGDTVQWAWQERWRPVERLTSESKTKAMFVRETIGSVTAGGNCFIQDELAGKSLGLLKFLDISYFNYQYNYKLEEFTTTTFEGYHLINFIAPEKDPFTGEYQGYIGIQLDGGPIRGISWTSQDWLMESTKTAGLDAADYNIDLYSLCTGQQAPVLVGSVETSWLVGNTLFDDTCSASNDNLGGAASAAEDVDQMVQHYRITEELGEITEKKCFQKGLLVNVDTTSMNAGNLPTKKSSVLNNVDDSNNSVFGEKKFVVVCGVQNTITLNVFFDYRVKSVAAVEMIYTYGAEPVDSGSSKTPIYKYYHIPAFKIYRSDDGVTKNELLYENPYMVLYFDSSTTLTTETKTYTWDNKFDYIYSGSMYAIVELRVTPTAEELSELTDAELKIYGAAINCVSYELYDVYEEVLTDASEPIRTWERKYYVSYGKSGDSPPQGASPETVSTLFPRSVEKSTPYHVDSSTGILNMDGSDKTGFITTSKVRGRILHKIYEDGTALKDDIYTLEGEQKKLFDASISINPEEAYMAAVIPPTLEGLLTNEGVRFLTNKPTLSFKNTLLTELAEINSFEPMSGEGHKYIPSEYSQGKCDYQGPCGSKMDAVFDYVFTSMDEDAGFTGSGGQSAFEMYYSGTENFMMRKEMAELLVENVFNKKYGGSSDYKIWVDDGDTTLTFPTLTPLRGGSASQGVNLSYNLDYFAISMNWHNAYFDTARRSGETPITIG